MRKLSILILLFLAFVYKADAQTGIGTTAPVNKLEVVATAADPASSNSSANGNLRLGNSSAAHVLDFGLSSSSTYSWLQSRSKSNYATNYNLVLNPNGGMVGIGNTSPAQTLDVTGTGKFSTGIINSGNRTFLGKDGANMHWFATTDNVSEPSSLAYGFESNGTSIQSHKWYIGGVEKMKIASNGYVGIGTSSPYVPLLIQGSESSLLKLESTTSDAGGLITLNINSGLSWTSGNSDWHEFMMFQRQGTTIGQITNSGSNSVNYNTSSDYRLKTDLKNFNGLEIINKIKTYDFAWKQDGSRMYGFMAHEFQEILPYAVSGKKDQVDENGKPIMQSVDYSKLTPILVKAIQEQEMQINQLKKEKNELQKMILDMQRRLLKLEKKKH